MPVSTPHRFGYVSLLGRPNAGKSTLLNQLVGTKIAIVSDKPQTTRTRIVGVKTLPSAQVVFLDTPGIHRPLHRMNVRMVDIALESMRQVDVVGLVVDVSEPIGKGDRFLVDLVRPLTLPVVLVLNKIDLVAKPRLLPIIDWFRQQRPFAAIVPVSALTGNGVPELEEVLIGHLPEGEALYPPDHLTDQSERFLISEMVREPLLALTHAEIPFSTAVVVDQVDDAKPGLLRIYCTIFVEHDSQKPIVIGKGGSLLKKVGTMARTELERFFDTKVFLDLHVKVKERWRDDERILRQMGFGSGE